MSQHLLHSLLPPKLIALISAYIHPPKDPKFITKWMHKLSSASKCQHLLWKFMIRDSAKLPLDLPEYQLSQFNFAHFCQQLISHTKMTGVGPLFEEFAIQSIRNNVRLVFNRYYVGNGGSQVFELLATFLVSKMINGGRATTFREIQQHAFNVLKWCLENVEEVQNSSHLYYALSISYLTTSKTKQTIDLLLFYLVKDYLQQQQQQQNVSEDQQYRVKDIGNFFRDVFRLLAYVEPEHYIFKNKEEWRESKKVYWEVLVMVDQKHEAIFHLFADVIIESLVKHGNNQQFIQKLIKLQNFNKLMYRQQYYFQIFKKRSKKIAQILWENKQKREQMCKAEWKGKNLLQIVAPSYGLTHNLINMLWHTGFFVKMPVIRNKKSREKVQEEFQCKFEDSQQTL